MEASQSKVLKLLAKHGQLDGLTVLSREESSKINKRINAKMAKSYRDFVLREARSREANAKIFINT